MHFPTLPRWLKPKRLLTSLLDTLLPRPCPICGSRLSPDEKVICCRCMLLLPRWLHSKSLDSNTLLNRLKKKMTIQRAAAWFVYDHEMSFRYLIFMFKYHFHPEVAEWTGRTIAKEMKDDGFFEGIDALVPVPLTPKRQRWRGYNQCTALAHGVSEVTGIPVIEGAVARIKFTISQTKLNIEERQKNVENAYVMSDASLLEGKHILLIDDVVTTGSTISSCARVIEEACSVRISVLAVACH